MLLIKQPMIEKCYSALSEQIGPIDFKAGTLWEQEGYKYNVFTKGHDIMAKAEGGYYKAGGDALGIVPEGLHGMQNLVDWRDVSDYYAVKKHTLLDAGLRQLFTSVDDEEAFKVLRSALGNKYAIITYFFFLKDQEKYAVMRPLNFADRLAKIGASAKCTTACSWENYKLFLSILAEVRDYLSGKMDNVGLLEAHSFLWALWQI